MSASEPVSVTVPVPEPATVTPSPASAVTVPADTSSVTVTDPSLSPVKAIPVSAFVRVLVDLKGELRQGDVGIVAGRDSGAGAAAAHDVQQTVAVEVGEYEAALVGLVESLDDMLGEDPGAVVLIE